MAESTNLGMRSNDVVGIAPKRGWCCSMHAKCTAKRTRLRNSGVNTLNNATLDSCTRILFVWQTCAANRVTRYASSLSTSCCRKYRRSNQNFCDVSLVDFLKYEMEVVTLLTNDEKTTIP